MSLLPRRYEEVDERERGGLLIETNPVLDAANKANSRLGGSTGLFHGLCWES